MPWTIARRISAGAGLAAGLLSMTTAFAQDRGVAPPGPIKRVAVNGTELAYVQQGQGPPVVLVLGAVGDYRVWAHQVAGLSTRHRVIAYSFRYHHPNAPPGSGAADYTLPVHAEDLAMLIRSLGLGPTHLVGYSYGGSVAALVGRDHPELVRSLVLAEPPLYSLLSRHPEAASLLAERTVAMAGVQDALKAGNDAAAIRRFLGFTLAPSGFGSLSAGSQNAMEANARVLPLLLQGIPAPFNCEDAGSIKAPTLLVTGERTLRLFTLTIDELERCLPNRERVTLPGTSHGLPLEAPAAFNEAVLRFLARY
jgi:non-heme chloroperoxidase